MKQEEGIVLELRGKLAHIRVGRHEECVSCGACGGAQNVTVDAVNELGAQPGQHVKFEMQETNVLTGAFMVFILPLLAAALGGFLGWQLGISRGMDVLEQESLRNPMVAGAGLFFFLSLIIVKLYDRRAGNRRQSRPVIVEIL